MKIKKALKRKTINIVLDYLNFLHLAFGLYMYTSGWRRFAPAPGQYESVNGVWFSCEMNFYFNIPNEMRTDHVDVKLSFTTVHQFWL